MSHTQKEIEEELKSLWVHSELTDNLCYRQLLSEMAYLIRAFVKHLLPHHLQEVEDLVQECLLAAHLKRHTYTNNVWITDWLYDICVYKWSQHQRRHHRSVHSATGFEGWHEIARHQQNHSAYVSRHDIARLMRVLSPTQKLAVNLALLGNMSVYSSATAQKKHSAHLHNAILSLYRLWSH